MFFAGALPDKIPCELLAIMMESGIKFEVSKDIEKLTQLMRTLAHQNQPQYPETSGHFQPQNGPQWEGYPAHQQAAPYPPFYNGSFCHPQGLPSPAVFSNPSHFSANMGPNPVGAEQVFANHGYPVFNGNQATPMVESHDSANTADAMEQNSMNSATPSPSTSRPSEDRNRYIKPEPVDEGAETPNDSSSGSSQETHDVPDVKPNIENLIPPVSSEGAVNHLNSVQGPLNPSDDVFRRQDIDTNTDGIQANGEQELINDDGRLQKTEGEESGPSIHEDQTGHDAPVQTPFSDVNILQKDVTTDDGENEVMRAPENELHQKRAATSGVEAGSEENGMVQHQNDAPLGLNVEMNDDSRDGDFKVSYLQKRKMNELPCRKSGRTPKPSFKMLQNIMIQPALTTTKTESDKRDKDAMKEKFECPDCGQAFIREGNFLRHMTIVHSKNLQTSQSRKRKEADPSVQLEQKKQKMNEPLIPAVIQNTVTPTTVDVKPLPI